MFKFYKSHGTNIKIERHKNDRLLKYDYLIWIADNECIDLTIKKILKNNNIIFKKGKFIKKESTNGRRKKGRT